MPVFYTGGTVDATAGFGSLLLPVVVMLAMLYFMMIRPENKRKKQAEEMRNSLKKGDQITTIGGIVGTICKVDESNNIIIETSDDRVRMELTKWAVSTNNSQQPEDKKGKKAKSEDDPPRIEEGSDSAEK